MVGRGMTVNRYATQAGKKYESDLMKYLRQSAFDVERLRLTGAEDEGDLLLRSGPIHHHRGRQDSGESLPSPQGHSGQVLPEASPHSHGR